ANGCDSTIILNLSVNDIVFTETTVEICDGETYPFAGEDLGVSGVYRDTILGGSPSGCDIINQLTLIVHPNVEIQIERFICAGDTYTFGGETYSESGT